MSNDSATGGPLVPASVPAPLEGQALDRFVQQLIVGITGMPGASVRPRWQPEPPNIPEIPDDWAAVGIHNRAADTYAAIVHNPASAGTDTVFRQEFLSVLVSFYGSGAGNNAAILRDGLSVPQNREVLTNADMGLVSVGDIVVAPTLRNERWQYRVDVSFDLVRAIRRTYPVLNLASASGTIVTDNDPPLSASINVEQP